MKRITTTLAALAVAAGLSIASVPTAEAARWRFPVLSTHCGVEAAWALSGAVQNRHVSVRVWERVTLPGFSEVCVTARDLRRTARPVVMVVRNLRPPAVFRHLDPGRQRGAPGADGAPGHDPQPVRVGARAGAASGRGLGSRRATLKP